jgi:predicted enzyme related to lactoylglutathione lyase
MLMIGDVHVYVTDMVLALRFYAEGLQFTVAEKEISPHAGYARLDCPEGGPSIQLTGLVDPYPEGQRPEPASRPEVRFDLTTTTFNDTLARILEHGGKQLGEVEVFNELHVVTIADPDGNPIELLEVSEE